MPEVLDVYDINKNKIGKIIPRIDHEPLLDGEFIIALRAWIINRENKILFTRRSLNKTHPGKWEPTGGLLTSGEDSLSGMKREIKEEIGLDIKDNEITLINTQVEIEEHEFVNILRDVYLIRKDITEKDLVFADNEVIDAKFLTIEELISYIDRGESFEWLRSFETTYKEITKEEF